MHVTGRAIMLTATLLLAGCFGGPRILSSFGDLRGPEGYIRRDGPHNGIDIAGAVGSPVLAVADGYIVYTAENEGACGTQVTLRHQEYESIYCHLSDIAKRDGQVRRGEVIGHVGISGQRPGDGFEHVHLSVRMLSGQRVDPEKLMKGCFETGKQYPADRVVLTYPVPCTN